MNIIKFSLLISLLLLSGCNSSSNENETKESTKQYIVGKTTLSKGTICIDNNHNLQCDDFEPQTTSSEKGEYSFEAKVEDGSAILAQGGVNLVLLEDNSNLIQKTSFHKKNILHNLNTLSTLVDNAMDKGLTYQEAKEKIAQKYHLKSDIIETNPLDLIEDENNKNIFLVTHRVEEYVLHLQDKKSVKKSQKSDLNGTTNVIITEDDVDSALDGFDIFSFDLFSFKFKFTEYIIFAFTKINSISCDILSLGGLCTPYLENSRHVVKADENDSYSTDSLDISDLNGIWRTTDNYCIDFDMGFFTGTVRTYYKYSNLTNPSEKGSSFLIDSFDEDTRTLFLRTPYADSDVLIGEVYGVEKSTTQEDVYYFGSHKLISRDKFETYTDCIIDFQKEVKEEND